MKKLFLLSALVLSSITYPPIHAKVCSFCSTDNFDSILKENSKVVVDFYSPTCPPCMRLKPIFEELGKEMSDILFITVNAQQFSSLAYRYNVSSIPHLKIFEDGKIVATAVGYKSKTELKKWVNSYLVSEPSAKRQKTN